MSSKEKSQHPCWPFLDTLVVSVSLCLANFIVLAHVPNASRTHVLADQSPVFQYLHTLNVRLKLALGPTHRMAHVVPEPGGLATNFTLCH